MADILIKGAQIVNEGSRQYADVLIRGQRIEKIAPEINVQFRVAEINAEDNYLIPGAIDDQVHFREPGLTHKANIATESRAAVAGGVTSFMEMPNTNPLAVTRQLLEEKYAIASRTSAANYSFFMGTTNSNVEEVKRIDPKMVCGVKIFMGSSTGDMLVDDEEALHELFAGSPTLIATHCEVEARVKERTAQARQTYGDNIPAWEHPNIRDVEACYQSSIHAIELAKQHGTRLHILHISTGKETSLFQNDIPLEKKLITSEACVHHLWFTADDYERLGHQIKCNPAIKSADNKAKIWEALLDGRIDVIATDHAPHTWEEKTGSYVHAHAGLPLVQHSILMMLDHVKAGKISLERVVELMSHNVAKLFRIEERGFVREGYFADLVLVNPKASQQVEKSNLLYKVGWSPLEGHAFSHSIDTTIVSGEIAYRQGQLQVIEGAGQRMTFNGGR